VGAVVSVETELKDSAKSASATFCQLQRSESRVFRQRMERDVKLTLNRNVVRVPSSVKLALPEAAKALEQAWQRRRQELANWQPSNGWLIDPRYVRTIAQR
jgi:hypothetical protein